MRRHRSAVMLTGQARSTSGSSARTKSGMNRTSCVVILDIVNDARKAVFPTPQSGLSRRRKQYPPKVSQGRALAAEGVGRSRITLEAMGVAELLTADPLTRGRAV